MEKRKTNSAHIKDPDEVKDNLQKGIATGGEQLYNTYCAACHLPNGKGDGLRFPPLDSSEYVNGDKNKLINIVLNGLHENITVKGKQWNNAMPAHNFLSDDDLALVLTYIRTNFGNKSTEIKSEDVKTTRDKSVTKK